MVSQRSLPNVSGKETRNKQHKTLANPKTPATSKGLIAPPTTMACLAIATAEFLTHVGNSSSVYISRILNAVQAVKNATISSPICTAFNSSPTNTTHPRLHTPLTTPSPATQPRRLSLSISSNVTNDADGVAGLRGCQGFDCFDKILDFSSHIKPPRRLWSHEVDNNRVYDPGDAGPEVEISPGRPGIEIRHAGQREEPESETHKSDDPDLSPPPPPYNLGRQN
nr:hypothetical protein AALP_AA2G244000 [Ipomoea batatas]